MTLIISLIFILSSINLFSSYLYNGSDVVKYALTAHGIQYKLRDRNGSLNKWKVGEYKLNNVKRTKGKIFVERWGNTDCSGLANASLRVGQYFHPKSKKKDVLSTWYLADNAKKKQKGLYFASGVTNRKNIIHHGDILNRTGKPYGHVFMFNGHRSDGRINTVEARCSKCGVGTFSRSWSTLKGYRIIRSVFVKDDVQNRRTSFILNKSSAAKTTFNQIVEAKLLNYFIYLIKPGDNLYKIAKKLKISYKRLIKINNKVNFKRLKIGQKIKYE